MGKTKIEWATDSWNPIRASNKATGKVGWHCAHVTHGCENCYSESMNARLGTGLPFKPGHRKDVEIFLDEKMLIAPLGWKKPRRIFVCSMTDAFADFVLDEWLDRMFALMALAQQHTFIVLTKRSKRMREYISAVSQSKFMNLVCSIYDAEGLKKDGLRVEWPLPAVWLGVSAEDQTRADERVPDLLATPAAVRFVSAEPLLAEINFDRIQESGSTEGGGVWKSWESCLNGKRFDEWSDGDTDGWPRLDLIITGGESGHGARPMHPDWARSIRDQCEAARVPFFFKQWGEWAPLPEEYPIGKFDRHSFGVSKIGKKRAGRLLDGIEHNDLPGALI